MSISGATASPPGAWAQGRRLQAAARTALPAAWRRHAASGAGSRRSGGGRAPVRRRPTAAARSCRKASTSAASVGSTGFRYSVSSRKASMQTLQMSCSAASMPACLASSQGLCAVDVLVDPVGQQHHLAQRLAELAGLVQVAHRGGVRAQAVEQHAALDAHVGRQPAAEALAQEARGAAGDVDVLAHQVAVDAGDEVLGVEVQVLDPRVELGGDVVAQPLGVQAQLQVASAG